MTTIADYSDDLEDFADFLALPLKVTACADGRVAGNSTPKS
jgi:hypothetical protein